MSETNQTDTIYVSDQEDDMGHTPVYVDIRGQRTELSLRTDLINHSPTGFSWGYRGSGSSQLALSITAHALEDDELAKEHYMKVRDEFLVDSEQPFKIRKSEVLEFLISQ